MRCIRAASRRQIDELGNWRSVPGLWDSFENEGDLADDVRRAYQSAASRHPGMRRLLDENEHHPAIETSVRRERALIALAAGVAHSSAVIGSRCQQVRVPEQRRGVFARIFQPA